MKSRKSGRCTEERWILTREDAEGKFTQPSEVKCHLKMRVVDFNKFYLIFELYKRTHVNTKCRL